YKKGWTMMQEACDSKAETKNFCGNRTVHFIVAASLLLPIVNTIVTLVLHCLQKKAVKAESSSASAQSTTAGKPPLKERIKPNLQSQSTEQKPKKEEPIPFNASDIKPKPPVKIEPKVKKEELL